MPYWRDRKDLAPGDAWRQRIRDAVRSGFVTFLACFSDASRARETSYLNEQLTLAVEEFRLRPPGATCLIPVRFDGGKVAFAPRPRLCSVGDSQRRISALRFASSCDRYGKSPGAGVGVSSPARSASIPRA
ncbi:toll/interleukin-1 receptor domain-containing protein [Rathayibacter sp. AY1E2]|uniref:toll/interleukin-1 receptor domain-containing protein n=1 Tax=Rathayibacter sp. AY1E2 TaxID=2080550 RepID=UPI0035BE44DC